MLIPRNMMIDTVDDPRPLPEAGLVTCSLGNLVRRLNAEYDAVEGPPRACFAVGRGGKVLSDSEWDAAKAYTLFKYSTYGFRLSLFSTEPNGAKAKVRLFEALYAQIAGIKKEGRLVWRRKPGFSQYGDYLVILTWLGFSGGWDRTGETLEGDAPPELT